MSPAGRGSVPVNLLVLVLALGLLVLASVPGGSVPSGFDTGLASALGVDSGLPGAGLRGTSLPGAASVPIDTRSSSRSTVGGIGKAAGLKVTVSQTTNLVNQNVEITWTGGKPTVGLPAFAADYLQIMQCWGVTTPAPEQCQFGAKVATDLRGGENAASRKLALSTYQDPAESRPVNGSRDYVSFRPVTGKPVTGNEANRNAYYDQNTTNEIPFATTRGDGRGFESFEVQTDREAPGLGCGAVIASGTQKGTIRNCWIVIVVRGETEVDGSPLQKVIDTGSHRLDSSPLSATNWKNRIAIPIRFAPAGTVCSIDAKQRPLSGSELSAEAVLRWQPALCRNKGPVFSYATIAESVVQRKLLGSDPGVGLLTAPVAPGQVTSDRILVYAPVAVSGVAISFLIERQSSPEASKAVKDRDGERITDVRLTPKLVAKLLTQSYVQNVSPNARYLKDNPSNIAKDPEFLALNPQFKQLNYRDTIETLVPIGLSDSNDALWRWIASDQAAMDFVAGLPDIVNGKPGMRVNPFYQGQDVPRSDFPRVDPLCEKIVADAPAICTLDRHPYAQDFHEAARSASRGDSLSRVNWDVNGAPPTWKKSAPQLNGQRQVIATSDTATIARYGLVTAKLRNAAGNFVAPERANLAAGLAAMQPSAVPGVLVSDPASRARAAYPLTQVTYAATAPNILTKDAARDYAAFVRFAVGAGQKPGTGVGNLPNGYLPLTAALRNRALVVAKAIQSRKGPKPSATPDDGPSGTGGSSSSGGTPRTTATTPAPTSTPAPAAAPAAAVKEISLTTPGTKTVFARYALLIALTLGSCALIVGALLPRLARRLRQ